MSEKKMKFDILGSLSFHSYYRFFLVLIFTMILSTMYFHLIISKQDAASGQSNLVDTSAVFTEDWLRTQIDLYLAAMGNSCNKSDVVINDIDPFSQVNGINVWDLYPPVLSCPDLKRIGNIGEGGKWICDLTSLSNRGECIVYSFGISSDISFEIKLLQSTNCTIHAFDPTVGKLPLRDLKTMQSNYHKRIVFHKAALAETSMPSDIHTINEHLFDIMYRLNHSFVDLLKIDIEGAEWGIFKQLLQNHRAIRLSSTNTIPIGQLLIELHYSSMAEIQNFFDSAACNGFYSFSREINLQPCIAGGKPTAAEYSFINPSNYYNWNKYEPRIPAVVAAAAVSKPISSTKTLSSLITNATALQHLSILPPAAGGGGDVPYTPSRHVPILGVIYLLTHHSRVGLLKRSLTLLYENFYQFFPHYPLILFHDDLEASDMTAIQLSVPNMPLQFHWIVLSIPLSSSTSSYLKKEIPERTACAPATSTIGYRHMCRFHANAVHTYLIQLGYGHYDYIMRLDDDSEITAPVGYDIFRYMKENNKLYGFVSLLADDPLCVRGLWKHSRMFIKNYKTTQLNKRNESASSSSFALFDEWRDGIVFYNNFEISHFSSLWQSPLWQQYMRYIDDLGGIYTVRWGDAPLHTIGVTMQLQRSEIHAFTDIGYRHTPFVDQEPTGLNMPGIDPFLAVMQLLQCHYYKQWMCTSTTAAANGNYRNDSDIHIQVTVITKHNNSYYNNNIPLQYQRLQQQQQQQLVSYGSSMLNSLLARYEILLAESPSYVMPVYETIISDQTSHLDNYSYHQQQHQHQSQNAGYESVDDINYSGDDADTDADDAAAVFYSFGHIGREQLLGNTLISLFAGYLAQFPCPVIIFFHSDDTSSSNNSARDSELTAASSFQPELVLKQIKLSSSSSLSSNMLMLLKLIKFYPVTTPVDPKAYHHRRHPLDNICSSSSSLEDNIESMHTMLFLRYNVMQILKNLGYHWMLRFGDDSQLLQKIHYNLFHKMRDRGKLFGYINRLPERVMACVDSLWVLADTLCNATTTITNTTPSSASYSNNIATFNSSLILSNNCSNLRHYWPQYSIILSGGFAVSHKSLWDSPVCTRLFQATGDYYDRRAAATSTAATAISLEGDRSSSSSTSSEYYSIDYNLINNDQPYMNWADSAVHTICVIMALSKKQILHMNDIKYHILHWGADRLNTIATEDRDAVQNEDKGQQRQRQAVLDSYSSISLPDYDHVFAAHRIGWIGGDVAASISLPNINNNNNCCNNNDKKEGSECLSSSPRPSNKLLWLFGDSIIGVTTSTRRIKEYSTMIANTIGVATLQDYYYEDHQCSNSSSRRRRCYHSNSKSQLTNDVDDDSNYYNHTSNSIPQQQQGRRKTTLRQITNIHYYWRTTKNINNRKMSNASVDDNNNNNNDDEENLTPLPILVFDMNDDEEEEDQQCATEQQRLWPVAGLAVITTTRNYKNSKIPTPTSADVKLLILCHAVCISSDKEKKKTDNLQFRQQITVLVVVENPYDTPDTWIYTAKRFPNISSSSGDSSGARINWISISSKCSSSSYCYKSNQSASGVDDYIYLLGAYQPAPEEAISSSSRSMFQLDPNNDADDDHGTEGSNSSQDNKVKQQQEGYQVLGRIRASKLYSFEFEHMQILSEISSNDDDDDFKIASSNNRKTYSSETVMRYDSATDYRLYIDNINRNISASSSSITSSSSSFPFYQVGLYSKGSGSSSSSNWSHHIGSEDDTVFKLDAATTVSHYYDRTAEPSSSTTTISSVTGLKPLRLFQPLLTEASMHYNQQTQQWIVVSLQLSDSYIKLCRSPKHHHHQNQRNKRMKGIGNKDFHWECSFIARVEDEWLHSSSSTVMTYAAKAHTGLLATSTMHCCDSGYKNNPTIISTRHTTKYQYINEERRSSEQLEQQHNNFVTHRNSNKLKEEEEKDHNIFDENSPKNDTLQLVVSYVTNILQGDTDQLYEPGYFKHIYTPKFHYITNRV